VRPSLFSQTGIYRTGDTPHSLPGVKPGWYCYGSIIEPINNTVSVVLSRIAQKNG
jgi:hypothetical protein